MPDDIVLVAGARTAIGKFNGGFAATPAHELGAAAIRAALERARIEPGEVDEVVMGQVGQVGSDAYNARRCALAAGLPTSVTAQTVNRLCSSGLQAIWTAANAISNGDARIAVAGGDENMTMQPFLDYGARGTGKLGNRVLVDGTLSLLEDPFGRYQMGETAEIVAERYGVSRADQDRFALESQHRAQRGIESGVFDEEIAAVGEVKKDEHPRANSTLEGLTKLKPAFRKAGTVTAGNAAGINDGAAAVVMMNESEARRRGYRGYLAFRGAAVAALAPEIMGVGPTLAIKKLVERTGVKLSDVDIIELNEAFAAQAVAVIRETGLHPEKTNPNGGAIAFGHPIGATGAILTVKLHHALRRSGKRLGIVTMCIGGGQGMAALFECR